MSAPSFQYAKSYRIPYRGCTLDSLLELRFVLSIEEEYRFLREPVVIGYHPTTYLSTDYHREGIKTYTPDFLIRHRRTEIAALVEIKPDGYPEAMFTPQRQAAEHFIARHSYDWQFKFLLTSDICLTDEQQKRYDVIAAKKKGYSEFYALAAFDKSQAYRHRKAVPVFREDGWDSRSYAWWVRRGSTPMDNRC